MVQPYQYIPFKPGQEQLQRDTAWLHYFNMTAQDVPGRRESCDISRDFSVMLSRVDQVRQVALTKSCTVVALSLHTVWDMITLAILRTVAPYSVLYFI